MNSKLINCLIVVIVLGMIIGDYCCDAQLHILDDDDQWDGWGGQQKPTKAPTFWERAFSSCRSRVLLGSVSDFSSAGSTVVTIEKY